jgi:UDP-N-acetyl-2-amino-2-deoxyglucuronate dehydrogenase
MKAIRDTGNTLVAAIDPNDSVGIIDSYFPEADFFVEFERFDRHIEKLRRAQSDRQTHYVSICSPNHLHDAHIRFALRSGAHAICEKPIVLNPWNIDGLQEVEADSPARVYTILQLRLHPSIIALRQHIQSAAPDHKFDVDLSYITSRGKWYHYSWKGDEQKSGGVATNIGVHFYDVLHYLFGNIQQNIVHYRDRSKAAGYLEYDRARVRWLLSVDAADLPDEARRKGLRTFRALTIGGQDVEFSDGFTDLHTRVYEDILSGGGYGLEDTRVSIETVSAIRTQTPVGLTGDYHPYLRQILR